MKADNEIIQLGENLKFLRERAGLSLKQLSLACGVSAYMLRNIENAILTNRCSAKHLLKICGYFEVSPDQMFSPINVTDLPNIKAVGN